MRLRNGLRFCMMLVACSFLTFAGISRSDAGIITGGNLLDAAGADQLEAWLGVGDRDFTNIWSGQVGGSDTNVASWHAAVDNAGPTFSIYNMDLGDGNTALIGGYTDANWGGDVGYRSDLDAFIFNLTSGEVQRQVSGDGYFYGDYSIYARNTYFATFGAGFDILGGGGNLGDWNEYTTSYTYEHSKGQISVVGDSGAGNGDSGLLPSRIEVIALETYIFSDPNASAPVPEPATIALLGIGLAGLAGAAVRRRFRQKI